MTQTEVISCSSILGIANSSCFECGSSVACAADATNATEVCTYVKNTTCPVGGTGVSYTYPCVNSSSWQDATAVCTNSILQVTTEDFSCPSDIPNCLNCDEIELCLAEKTTCAALGFRPPRVHVGRRVRQAGCPCWSCCHCNFPCCYSCRCVTRLPARERGTS